MSPTEVSVVPGTESGPAITIVGTGFTGATRVTLGEYECEKFTVINDTQMLCIAPNYITEPDEHIILIFKNSVVSDNNTSVLYTGLDYPTLQAADAYAKCSTTPQLFRDERDNQLYYVKKMDDGKCWMVDNLKYAGYGELHTEAGEYLTADGGPSYNAANVDVAKYVDPGGSDYCTSSLGVSSSTRCGLMYNWFAATNGTGTFDIQDEGSQAIGSICPANFRLPSAYSGTSGATTDGTSTDVADFPVLNASMNAGMPMVGSTEESYYAGWQQNSKWRGLLAGVWTDGLESPNAFGVYWSSTSTRTYPAAGILQFANNVVFPGNSVAYRMVGATVRCVMDSPEPELPDGVNPDNISATNPAVLDVYPTTGWEGDTVAITSNALFTNVTDVKIGGTTCTRFNVVSSSVIGCVLPGKTAGTSNAIEVTNNVANITNAGTYTHMRVTYFDPAALTVDINGDTYKFFTDSFTSANCSSMATSNAAIGSEPNNSITYVRDTRNKQTYKVKKMADNKCWMVDNLKYIDTSISNMADGTTGMRYNNGDHLNSGTAGKTNTVDGTTSQSPTNSDKAFYNNPMGTSYCYGSANMPMNTLTNCGYLYNWYAATAGTGAYNLSTSGNQATDNVCPSGFSLPTATSNSSDPSANGTSSAAADYPVLNASMNAGALATGSTNSTYNANWLNGGPWGGAFSGGYFTSTLSNQGNYGDYWTATAGTATTARSLHFDTSVVGPGNGSDIKYYGLAVRCVIR